MAHQLGEVAVLVGAGARQGTLAAAARLERIISDLHDLSAEVRSTAVLDVGVEAVAAAERLSVPGRPVSVVVEGAVPPVDADQALLAALLGHVMRPVVAASRDGARFRLRAGPAEGGRILIEIEDEMGASSDEDARRRLAPFARPEGSGSVLGAGVSGPAARRIVEAHGGELRAHGGDRGLVVTFDLPAASSE